MRKKKPADQRELKADEKLLWNLVTRTVTPMRAAEPKVEPPEDLAEQMRSLFAPAIKSAPISAASLRAAKTAAQAHKAVHETHHNHRAKPIKSPAPIASHLDRPVYRKISKGRVPIDSTIDLHNLTQEQAVQRLLSFLTQAHDLGHRHVLVITGKGGSPTSEGVLKRMLPVWLNTPAFSAIVNGYQSASRNHGGDGAFYVRLRKWQ